MHFLGGTFASVRYNLTSPLATGEAACGGDALHATPHPFFKSSPPQPATTSDGFFAQEPSRLRWRYAATHILLSLTNGLGCPRSPSLVFLCVSRFRRTQRKKIQEPAARCVRGADWDGITHVKICGREGADEGH